MAGSICTDNETSPALRAGEVEMRSIEGEDDRVGTPPSDPDRPARRQPS
jgi:hypothetical protein